jgi:rhodanese-related sulfurtransferase
LLVLAVIPAVVGAWLHPKAPGWQQAPMAGAISWAAAQALPNALWIDARSPDEFARDHVAGALSLPPAEWDAHIEKVLGEWQPGRSLVVYCGGGGCKASQAVAERLRTELGLTEVHVLTGGWSGQTTENAP